MIKVTPQRALEVGKAGEHLVCADLILAGHGASLASAGLTYDVIVDINDRLFRVQVKTTARAKQVGSRPQKDTRICYSFNVRRRGRRGNVRLNNSDCDLLALVALDIKCVAYLPIARAAQTVQLLPPQGLYVPRRGAWAARIDQYTLDRALDPHFNYESFKGPVEKYLAAACPQGHPYTAKNSVFYNGVRCCRECRKVRWTAYNKKMRDAKQLRAA